MSASFGTRHCALKRGALNPSNVFVKVDIDLSKADSKNFDGIIFVGGPGAEIYFEDKKCHELARKFYKENKVVAAICIAPSILANTGLLEGKRATAFPSQEGHLVMKRAKFKQTEVVVDGKIVTANGPKASRQFGEEIAKLLV
ncbi:DJ-1/PfpI family protein [Candidatus Woesearchaeota archaeon]|nr:DJ-1/PfpI family protein [Candidatus Woesearchaeota archaeon]